MSLDQGPVRRLAEVRGEAEGTTKHDVEADGRPATTKGKRKVAAATAVKPARRLLLSLRSSPSFE